MRQLLLILSLTITIPAIAAGDSNKTIANYNLTKLGDASTDTHFRGVKLNDFGQVLGSIDQSLAAIWTPINKNSTSGNMTIISDGWTFVQDINSEGTIVGSKINSSTGGFLATAWTPASANTSVGTHRFLSPSVNARPDGISDAGLVVGTAHPYLEDSRLVLWRNDSDIVVDIGAQSTTQRSGATAMSGNGLIVGWIADDTHSAIWENNPASSTGYSLRTLPSFEGNHFGAQSVDYSGQYLFGSLYSDAGFAFSPAVVKILPTEFQLIRFDPNADGFGQGAILYDINASGIAVGSCPITGGYTACLWTEKSGFLDLSKHTGQTLTEASHINSVGQLLAGESVSTSSYYQSYLLSPISAVPESPTYILMLLGFVSVGAYRMSFIKVKK
jgi:hypothetical protein